MKAPRFIKFQVFLGILLFTAVVTNAATAVLPAEPDPSPSLETHLKTKFSRMTAAREARSMRNFSFFKNVSSGLIACVIAATSVVGADIKEMNPPVDADESSLFALVGGRLIDGWGGAPIEKATVVVKGTRIVAAGSAEAVSIPAGARVIDATGMSVLPGLFDSHFHSRFTIKTPVEYELKRGITSFRDPGHPFKYYSTVMESKETLPRVFLCGGHLDGPPPVWADQAILVKDAAHARRAVNAHVDRGASVIKVYFRLPLEHVKAACEAARERGVLVTGHLELVDADAAIRVGVHGIEHVTSFGTSLAEAKDVERFKMEIRADSNARRKMRYWLWSRIDLDTSAKVKPLLDLIVKKKVFVSPTLAVFERQAGKKNGTEEEARAFANMVRFVGMCHEAGAKVVVGSHTSAPFAERGRAYQREMELLVEAGMTPLEVITGGTRHNAEFFGVEDRLGTIEAGKTADLVLIKGAPSRDIGAMRNVARVMLNGSWIDKAR